MVWSAEARSCQIPAFFLNKGWYYCNELFETFAYLREDHAMNIIRFKNLQVLVDGLFGFNNVSLNFIPKVLWSKGNFFSKD